MIIIDLRSREEYNEHHVCNSVNISTPTPPLLQDDIAILKNRLTNLLHKIPKDHPIYLYCKKGIRSRIAKRILEQELGFTNVVNLGGIQN